ncbi:MFS transporter [Tamaricihabitans halophyticus]|uniref:MFS transporter n=1 Tax=Tamaricihabitans halophyticus TaxID=1262583 RepID=A0A4R2QCM0_9PSEU|nr:MFS transporter [Tamaricihabitans halophyticus]
MHPAADAAAPPRARAREWLGLAVLGLPCLLLVIDITMLFLAIPVITADLGAGSTQQLWILDIYGFMIAGFLVTMGALGDRIGRRRLLMIGAAAFAVASVAATFSTSAEMLIATRALLGVAGATVMPSTLALIRNLFLDTKQRALAIAIWSSTLMAGLALGPVVGGIMLESFWWGSVFLLGVPVMTLVLLAGPFLLPEYRDPAPGRLNLTSVVLSLLAILPTVYAIKSAANYGIQPATFIALFVGHAQLGGRACRAGHAVSRGGGRRTARRAGGTVAQRGRKCLHRRAGHRFLPECRYRTGTGCPRRAVPQTTET